MVVVHQVIPLLLGSNSGCFIFLKDINSVKGMHPEVGQEARSCVTLVCTTRIERNICTDYPTFNAPAN